MSENTEAKGIQETEDNQTINDNNLVSVLNKLSKRIDRDIAEKEEKVFIYNPKTERSYEECESEIEEYKEIINCYGYDVEVQEHIEVSDVTEDSRFFICIMDNNNTKVDIDLFIYKEIVLDYNISEYEYVEKIIERMSGGKFNEIEELVSAIISYLSYVCYFKQAQMKVYSKIGWMKYDGLKIFKYDSIYAPLGAQIRGECISNLKDSLVPMKDSEKDMKRWVDTAVKLINYSAVVSLTVGAGISGVIRQILNPSKERNINFNLTGSPGTGKTTATDFVLSIFGKPEELQGRFFDTDNAMEIVRLQRAVIPYVIDDRMLKHRGKTETVKGNELLIAIFREYDGTVKERLGKQYKETSGQKTYSPVISSSVEPMLDALFSEGIDDYGQYRRFIEIEIQKKDLFMDSTHAEEVHDVSTTCYGYGIRLFINHIFDNDLQYDTNIKKTFDIVNKAIKDEIKDQEEKEHLTGLQSSSQRFALIVLSYMLFRNTLVRVYASEEAKKLNWKQAEEKAEKMIVDRTIDVMELLINNLVEKTKLVKERINAAKNILKMVNEHKDLFYVGSKQWDGKGQYLGQLTLTDNEVIIDIKKNSNIGWILVSPLELQEADLKDYIDTLITKNYSSNDKVLHDKLVNLVGKPKTTKFKTFISKYKDEVTYEDYKTASARFDRLIVSTKKYSAKNKAESANENNNDTKKELTETEQSSNQEDAKE